MTILNNLFKFWNCFSFTKKNCKDITEFPHTSYSVSLIINILYQSGLFVIIKKNSIDTLLLTKDHTLFRFLQVLLPDVPSIPESHPGYHITFHHHVSSRLLLAMTVLVTCLVFDDLDSCQEYWSGSLQNVLQMEFVFYSQTGIEACVSEKTDQVRFSSYLIKDNS